jgi:hypothetical protein
MMRRTRTVDGGKLARLGMPQKAIPKQPAEARQILLSSTNADLVLKREFLGLRE